MILARKAAAAALSAALVLASVGPEAAFAAKARSVSIQPAPLPLLAPSSVRDGAFPHIGMVPRVLLRPDAVEHAVPPSRVVEPLAREALGLAAHEPLIAAVAFDGGRIGTDAGGSGVSAAVTPGAPLEPPQLRSALFPVAMAAGGGATSAILYGIGAAAAAVHPHSPVLSAVLLAAKVLSWGAGLFSAGASLPFAIEAARDLNLLARLRYSRARRGAPGEKEIADFLEANVHPSMRGRVALEPPPHWWETGRAYGGKIYLRPELVRFPGWFQRVLFHEYFHLTAQPSRGPPSLWRAAVRGALSEVRARAYELRHPRVLGGEVRFSSLEQAAHETQLSLRLGQEVKIGLVNLASPELRDRAIYRGLVGGPPDVEEVPALASLSAKDKTRRYRALVLDDLSAPLKSLSPAQAKRLDYTLRQLDRLQQLANGRLDSGASPSSFPGGGAHGRRFQELCGKARLLVPNDKKGWDQLQREVRKFWQEIADMRLKGLEIMSAIGHVYAGLQNKGAAFLSFKPEDRSIETWEKLLAFWQSQDGGQFRASRVDFEDGSHVLVLRKAEPRIGLWLKPPDDFQIMTSVGNAMGSEKERLAARAALEEAGFKDYLKRFDELEVEVHHVFGKDEDRNLIYVTIPRRNAPSMRQFAAGASTMIRHSETNFQPHLLDMHQIHNLPPAWKLGYSGKGGLIMWIDTGADDHEDFAARLDHLDMVQEGREDWIGHGTHVAGISISGGAVYKGMAPGANGIMAKVFGKDTPGAADGPIMGSGVSAKQDKRGVDGVSLSLGSPGHPGSPLAVFFSDLTLQKNAKGEYMIVSASAGNSGPFDRTHSQPAAGEHVLKVAASSFKRKFLASGAVWAGRVSDMGISFFSSVGFVLDPRYAVKRDREFPDLAWKGGTVETVPGERGVYRRRGVVSSKARTMPEGPNDTEDGHTYMSGTSQAEPGALAAAVLLKLAIKATGQMQGFVKENLPFVVRSVLKRTARDMKAPVVFQGAGLGDGWAAIGLALSSAAGSAGARIARRLGLRTREDDAWSWVRRLKSLADLEDKVYEPTRQASAESPTGEDGEAVGDDESEVPQEPRATLPAKTRQELDAKFNAARNEALPALLEALKDPVWLVRSKAAFVLRNLKSPASAMALAKAAVEDEDARVRQMAFLALAEIPTHTVDRLLASAARHERWDTGVYAAYALARHGDARAVDRIRAELAGPDDEARYACAWLLGQLRDKATAAEAEALSSLVKEAAAEDNSRHVAAAALFNLSGTAPSALSARSILDLLDSAGPQDLALTRTIARVFGAALRQKEIRQRLHENSELKAAATNWVVKNRAAAAAPGALGEMVAMLARELDIPLDLPTPAVDPTGVGVPGVDVVMGPLDLIVELPAGRPPARYWGEGARGEESEASALKTAGVDPALLELFRAELKAALPLSGALWLRVPAHKVFGLSSQLEAAGLRARLSRALYPASRRPKAGATLIDKDGVAVPAEGFVDLSASAGVSEAKVMEVLEGLFSRADPLRRPVSVSLDLLGPAGEGGGLARLIDGLALHNVGMVLPAGNGGPGRARPLSSARAALVVAAADAQGRLQFYSPEAAEALSMAGVVDPLDLAALEGADLTKGAYGTGAAAARVAAGKAALAAEMAKVMVPRRGSLPDGYSLYIDALIKQTLTPLPRYPPQQVGGGLFSGHDPALEVLRLRLSDPDRVAADAHAMAERARGAYAEVVVPGDRPYWEGLRRAVEGKLAYGGSAPLGGNSLADIGEGPASPVAAGPRAERYRLVLGDGARVDEPFHFLKADGKWEDARSGGLEGFYFKKLELEQQGAASLAQLNDYFRYLEALLAPHAWTAGLRGQLYWIQRANIDPREKNARLNACLAQAIKAWQRDIEANDPSAWSLDAVIYEVFARAFNRLRPGKNFFESLDADEFGRIREVSEATVLWLMDIFEIGRPPWRWGSAGGSAYALRSYDAKPELGGEESFRGLLGRLREAGLRAGADEVPNHASVDSEEFRERPETFLHVVPSQDLSDEEILRALPRYGDVPAWILLRAENYPNGNGGRGPMRILVHHPISEYGGPWNDMLQRDYSRPETRDWETAQTRRIVEKGVTFVRRDMAYDVVDARFFPRWLYLLSEERARSLREGKPAWMIEAYDRLILDFKSRWQAFGHAEFLAQAREAMRDADPSSVSAEEGYAHFSDLSRASRAGFNMVYNKSDHDQRLGQVGLYDALVSRDAGRIRSALRNVAFRQWQRGGALLLNFVGTHDGGEGNPVDKFGRQFKAAVLMSLMFRPVLFYNGLEQGVGQRENLLGEFAASQDYDKAIPFEKPSVINWGKADQSNQDFLKLVSRKRSEHRELFLRGGMEVLEPAGGAPIVAWSVGGETAAGGVRALIAAANFSDGRAGATFRMGRPVLADFGAFEPRSDRRYLLRDVANLGPGGKPVAYVRDGRDLRENGLTVYLDAGGVHLFEVVELAD